MDKIKTDELPRGYYIYGNKGAVWSDKVHAVRTGEGTTLCGGFMLANNHAKWQNIDHVGCPDCLMALDIVNEVEKFIDIMFETMHEKYETEHGDILPDQHMHLEDIKLQLSKLAYAQIKQNL